MEKEILMIFVILGDCAVKWSKFFKEQKNNI